jgi:hypothetical protein
VGKKYLQLSDSCVEIGYSVSGKLAAGLQSFFFFTDDEAK